MSQSRPSKASIPLARGLATMLALMALMASVTTYRTEAARDVGTPAATPAVQRNGDTNPDLYAALTPNSRDAIYAATAGTLSRYYVDVAVAPATADALTAFRGTIDLLFVNPTDRPLNAAVFRLYANDPRYGDGEIVMRDVEVGGVPATPVLSVADTVATVALGTALAPGETVTVTYSFDGTVANDPAGSYGMFTYSPSSGTLALAHWYPILAGIEPDQDWNVEPVSVNGDPIYSNTSLYDVTITMPAEWKIAASGVETDVSTGSTGRDETAHRFVTGPSRDFTFVADATLDRISRRVGETEVVSWYNPGDESGAGAVLAAGVATVDEYEPLLGDYPYAQLDLVEVSVGNGAAGIEFPQLVFIGGSYYAEAPVTPPDTSYLESLVVHEVLHQWFYGLVGNDQYAHGFQDEGLVNYLMTSFYRLHYGEDAFAVAYLSQNEIPYLRYLFGTGDVVTDYPTDDYGTASAYVVAAYYKGAVAFGAVREAIGDEAFFDGLHRYVAEFRFAVATPDDLRACFEAASGDDLDALWANWFDEENGTVDFTPADLDADQQRLDALLAS